MPAAERDVLEQPLGDAAEVRQHVLHDQAAAQIGEHLPETVGIREGSQ